jgi:hypothetical protein
MNKDKTQKVRDYVADQHKDHAKSSDDRFTEYKVRNGGERHPIDPKRGR